MRQAAEYIQAQAEDREERAKEAALLLNGAAMQVVSGVRALLDKKGRYLSLQRLYPQWFSQQAPADGTLVWRQFLGV